MNIALIGYRGTGKSAVARLVAKATGREVFCMDAEIERRAGRRITEFVAERGWDAFRDLESEVARDAGALDEHVIDCGGGAVLRADNVAALKARGRMVWLQAGAETIANRLEGAQDRPSLTGAKTFLDEIVEVLAAREPVYRAAADLVISTENRSVEEVARAVAAAFPAGHTG